jgi:hypothetical protein
MNAIWEFFFCPVHGVFGAQNLQIVLPALLGMGYAAKSYLFKIVDFVKRVK